MNTWLKLDNTSWIRFLDHDAWLRYCEEKYCRTKHVHVKYELKEVTVKEVELWVKHLEEDYKLDRYYHPQFYEYWDQYQVNLELYTNEQRMRCMSLLTRAAKQARQLPENLTSKAKEIQRLPTLTQNTRIRSVKRIKYKNRSRIEDIFHKSTN